MTPAAAFVLVNGAGLLAGLATLAVAWRWRQRRTVLAALAGAVLALLVAKCVLAWQPVWEAALFPWPDYVFLQGYWMTVIALVFFATVVPQLPVVWNRWAVAVLALAVLGLGMSNTWWMVSWRPVGRDFTADARHHLQQTTGYTCAPSSCVIALSYLGITTTEREMAQLCLTRREEGTTAFNTYRGLMLKLADGPWRVRLRALPPAALLEPGRVAVIDWPQIRHAVCVVGAGDHVLLHDPLHHEPGAWSASELGERYGGEALVFERR